MVDEELKLALGLKLGQLEDDIAVGFAWAAAGSRPGRKRRLTAQLVPPPTGLSDRRRSSRSSFGDFDRRRTIMRWSWLRKG
jgi:hypothetical protein